MKNKKGFQVFVLILFTLILYLFSNHRYDNYTVGEYPSAPTKIFKVGVCSDSDGHAYRMYSQGFFDALSDYSENTPYGFESEQVFATESKSYPLSVSKLLLRDPDLVFAIGGQSLGNTRNNRWKIPVVFNGCMTYEPLDEKEPVTGILSTPDIDFTLSLLLETTPDLETVGIVYETGDVVSMYQNAIMEEYLDQAFIPWKEYEVPKVSEEDSLTPIPTLDEIAAQASEECSAIYIASGSKLTSRSRIISDIASPTGTVTVGGDASIGSGTYVSVFSDLYDQGYRAGTIAFRILVDKESPLDYPPSESSPNTAAKLYQDDIAMYFEKKFPKTFHEYDSFFADYTPGMLTSRFDSPSPQ